jgi:hypothetical protein
MHPVLASNRPASLQGINLGPCRGGKRGICDKRPKAINPQPAHALLDMDGRASYYCALSKDGD